MELKDFEAADIMGLQILQCAENVDRMKEHAGKLFKGNLYSLEIQDRPVRIWKNTVNDDAKLLNITNWTTNSRNRANWKLIDS